MDKPKIGVFGLTGCAGDQLVILDCEDELLDLAALLDIRDFHTASSAADSGCELDLALVEGAVFTRRDEEALRRIRQRSRTLVALGTCAVWGGVAAVNGNGARAVLLREIYGEPGGGYDSMAPCALHEVVKVDLNLAGCPIEKHEFLALVASVLNGDVPVLPRYPVCAECRMRESTCLLAERGELCCGPLTAGGCNARCPALNIACIGCRGPCEDANAPSALALFASKGIPGADAARRMRTFVPEGRR